jgi:anti-anti-sigma factor
MTTDGDAQPTAEPTAEPAALTGTPILDQAFDAGSLYALRAAVAAHVSQAGLAPGRSDDLVIAVHELAANAVRHGAGHGRLRIWRSDQALLCEVSDDGLPDVAKASDTTQPPQPPEPPEAPQWRSEPGHGLSLVRQVADQTTLRSGPSGTMATVTFALGPPGPPFRLARHERDDCTVLAVTGPLDLASAGQLTEAINALIRDSEPKLVLDLAALTGWDSAGLAALITAQQRISATPNARMILAGLPDHLEKRLRHAESADRFTLAENQIAAAEELSEA